MAKINVPFDNKNYLIDEANFASSANALKSHLSSVMNGTGATINFGGVPYNVDSAKLSAARNAFVSHLGTVAGNGYKVLVDGVEYNVDSSKMAGAIAELTTVLDGLKTGGSDSECPLHFGDKYSVITDDGKLSFVFYEDGSMKMYSDDKLVTEAPAGCFVYKQYNGHYEIWENGEHAFTISANGVELVDSVGTIFTLETNS